MQKTFQSQVSEQDPQAFFMTNCLEPKYEQNHKTSYSHNSISIDKIFQNTAKTLEQRRQAGKRQLNRMKEIENEFERRQSEKSKLLSKKLSSCSQIKQKSVDKVKERLKKISEKRNKVTSKARLQQLQQLNQHLRERKTLEFSGSKYSNSSRKSVSSVSDKRIEQTIKQIKIEEGKITYKLGEMNEKQNQARQQNLNYRADRSLRARSHNSIAVPEVNQRAMIRKTSQDKLQSSEAVGHIAYVTQVRDNREKKYQKEHTQKKKSQSQKMNRLHRNILQLQQTQNRKNLKLDQKYAKSHIQQWRDRRSQIPNKKILQNLSLIERTQQIKADSIVDKHREISLRNKMLRDRRQQMYLNHKQQTMTIN